MIALTLYYIHKTRDYRQYSAITYLHSPQFTFTHALRFSVFTRSFLTKKLSQSHCHFKSHTQSSCHSLIPFLSFLLNHLRLPSPVLFLLLFCAPSRLLTVPFYNHSAHTTQKTPSSVVKEACFAAPLPSNRRSIIERVYCGNEFIKPLPSIGYTRHNTIIPQTSRSCSWSLSLWLTHQTAICILLRLPMGATYPVPLILHDLAILIISAYNDHRSIDI
jgi:hypothetical protein